MRLRRRKGKSRKE